VGLRRPQVRAASPTWGCWAWEKKVQELKKMVEIYEKLYIYIYDEL